MNFEQIEEEYSRGLSKYNVLCEQRVRELVAGLENFTIDKIDMGMGCWSLHGPEFQIIYDDGSEGSKELHEIIYWMRDNYYWRPKVISDAEETIFEELIEICDWWIGMTGGDILTFKH